VISWFQFFAFKLNLHRYNKGQAPKTEDAQAIADEVFAEFVGEEVDKVEMIYSRFVSLILAEPSIQTILPLSKVGGCTSQIQFTQVECS
jgi:F0F1-type ATP synthase gamma subunit